MIRSIDEYRSIFSVEFICQALNIHREGGFLRRVGTASLKPAVLSARSLRDAALVEHIGDVHAEKLQRLRRAEDLARAGAPGH